MAAWRGDCQVEDWGPEPLPDPATDPAGFYHWRRDIERQCRAWRRAQARAEVRQAWREPAAGGRTRQPLAALTGCQAQLRAAWEGAGLAALPGLAPAMQKSYTKALDKPSAE